jgi:parallel beta-helix repeat protein
MQKLFFASILALLLLALPPMTMATGYTGVSVVEAKAMLDSNPSLVVLDVRTQSEYDSGHIRNAKHIPVTQLEGRLHELDTTDEILVYCKSGFRSTTASQLLVDHGFLYVFNMNGGIDAWKSQGYPVYVKYASIQAAINTANPGDVLLIASGTYYEHLRVNKTISLVGENNEETIVDGSLTGTAVEIIASNFSLAEFTIRNCHSGVVMNNSKGTHLRQNIIENFSEYGIHVSLSNDTILTDNTVSGQYWGDFGIRVSWSNGCIITDNDISGGWALLLQRSSNSTVMNNLIFAKGTYGIRLAYSYGNLITGNEIYNATATISDVGYGLWISYYSADNRIFHNNFFNNTVQAHAHNLTNAWDNGCEGNYWNNYNGTDSDGDGIGDTPYVLDVNNADNHPLISPFWNIGDINHDFKVDIFDVVLAAGSYGSTPSDPHWNPHCDIAEPFGTIDIFDIVRIATSYGEEYDL